MPKQKKEDELSPQAAHTPVMVREVLEYLRPSKGERYLDVTAGYGGHAAAVSTAAGALAQMVLVDRDEQAARALAEQFAPEVAEIVRSDFLNACRKLAGEGRQFDMILADLGASSPHFDDKARGFSFSGSGPLDMRMDRRQGLTADYFVNRADKQELETVLRQFGEEKAAGAVASAIVRARPIASTGELADVIERAASRRFGRRHKIHPATRSFQALRIAVNQEMEQLEASLPLWTRLLAPGGRLVVISFHSLEDRAVKRYLQEVAGDRYDAQLRLLTKKPITARPDEIVSNPRARSARLRAAAK